MPHVLYHGPFPALEEKLLDVITASKRVDPMAMSAVLVGSNALAMYLKRRLVDRARATANVRFYTFIDLVRVLQGPLSTEARRRIPSQGSRLLLDSVLEARTPPVFEKVRDLRGFRDALLDTFRDLRDAGISATELSRAAGHLVRKDPARRPHLDAVADLYRRNRAAASGFVDVDDDFRAAVGAAADAGEILGTRTLYVYGVYDVTGQQSDLLGALAAAIDVVFYVPYVDDHASAFAAPFLNAWKINALWSERLQFRPPRGELGLLVSGSVFGSFRGRDSDLADDGTVSLVSAPGDSKVAVEVVREVFRALRDGTIRHVHEAAVVLRHEDDVGVLAEALRLRGVPFSVYGGSSMAERPLARAALAVAGLEAEEYSRESVLAAFEMVSATQGGEPAAWNAAEWRALSNDPRFLLGFRGWEEGSAALIGEAARLLARSESGGPDEDESGLPAVSPSACRARLAAARAMREAWVLLASAAMRGETPQSWSSWAGTFERHLQPLLGQNEDWRELVCVLDALSALDGLALYAMKLPDLRTFTEALTSAVVDASRTEGAFLREGVSILGITAARGLRFPLVILPGLDEGRFPARLRQDPLLFDSERAAIGPAGRLPLKAQRFEEEKLLFDMAIRSAERRLVLLASRLDESGDRERTPSEFFLRTAAALAGRSLEFRDLTAEAVPGFRSVGLENPAPGAGLVAVDEGEIRLRVIAGSVGSSRRALDSVCAAEADLMALPLAFYRARRQAALTPYDGLIRTARLCDWIADRFGPASGESSASRLETYAQCPYRFYLRRVLDLEAWEEQEPALALDPMERGSAVHEILESFLRNQSAAIFQSAQDETSRQALIARAREVLQSVRPAGMPDLLWDIERESLERLLLNWFEFERERADGNLKPAELERSFGSFPGEGTPPLRIQAGRHDFSFRGRIDRIDRTSDRRRARVIDYKTGKMPENMTQSRRTPLMAGERIQIAVYAAAVQSVLDPDGEPPRVEGEYLHLQTGDLQTVPCLFDTSYLAKAMKQLPEMLAAIGDGLTSGAFFAKTTTSVRRASPCDYCDFVTICGRDRVWREERKSQDPAVIRFRALSAAEPVEDGESE